MQPHLRNHRRYHSPRRCSASQSTTIVAITCITLCEIQLCLKDNTILTSRYYQCATCVQNASCQRVYKCIQVNNESASYLDGGFYLICFQIIYQSDAVYTGLATPPPLGIGYMGWGPPPRFALICILTRIYTASFYATAS